MTPELGQPLSDVAGAVESLFTVLAIIVGGFWTYQLFVKKRQKYPHAEVMHSFSCRSIAADKILLSVDVIIRNIGEVLIALTSWEVFLKQMLPPNTELLMFLEKIQLSPLPSAQITQWQELASSRESEATGALQIEPGESEQFHYDFLVTAKATTIMFESYFRNAAYRWRAMGWTHITVHDVPQCKENR